MKENSQLPNILSTFFALAVVYLSNCHAINELRVTLQENNSVLLATVNAQAKMEEQKLASENKRLWLKELSTVLSGLMANLAEIQNISHEFIALADDKTKIGDEIVKDRLLTKIKRTSELHKDFYYFKALLDHDDVLHVKLLSLVDKYFDDICEERQKAARGEIREVYVVGAQKIFDTFSEVTQSERKKLFSPSFVALSPAGLPD